jgi:hypothetical protein
MKRTLESDLPVEVSTASNNTPNVVNPQKERLLFVLVPMKIAGVRKTLKYTADKNVDRDYLSVFQYEVGSADPKFDLDARLNALVEAHSPFQDHPDCIGDVDMTTLPLLLLFIADAYDVCRLPDELTHEGEELTPFATAQPKDLGVWEDDITDGDDSYSFTGPYKAVHFIPYDPLVVDKAAEKKKLGEDDQ